MTPKRLALTSAAAVLPLLLVGCGGDDGSGDGDGGGGGGGGGVDSAAAAAKVIGCPSSSDHETDEAFVTDAATCELEGQEVTVYYFSTNDARDSYVDAAGAFGGQYLVGDQFAVEADPELLGTLKGKVDGTTVKP